MDIKQYRYISAADFMVSDGSEDVADKLQQLIDRHPNHTIFFPDGVYLLSHPVLTPASPAKALTCSCLILHRSKLWKAGTAQKR